MAAKKYYAVKKGKLTGLFYSWDDCKQAVDGYPNADYKGFALLSEALAYLGIEEGAPVRAERVIAVPTEPAHNAANISGASGATNAADMAGIAGSAQTGGTALVSRRRSAVTTPNTEWPAPGTLRAYVDGSYDDGLKKYAFGCVFLLPEQKIYRIFGNGDNPQSLQHRNVTGEMLGAMYAVKTAMINGFGAIEIFYDYEGIEKWVSGEWKSRTELTGKYAASMREWGRSIRISFQKVPAHSNVRFNELADETAKRGIIEGSGVPKVYHFEDMEAVEE